MEPNSVSLRFACPHCEQHIECDLSWAGKDFDCPTCGHPIHAPAPVLRSETPLRLTAPEENNGPRSSLIREQAWTEPVKRRSPPAWLEQVANYSVLLPIVGLFLLLVFGAVLRSIPSIVSVPISILLILSIVSGGVTGPLATLYWFRYRGKGLVRALVGTSLSIFLVVVLFVPAVRRASEKYRELKQRKEMKLQHRK